MTIDTARDGSEFYFLPSEVYICNILAACAYFVERLRKCGQIYFKGAPVSQQNICFKAK
jgi:hypothetical protein